MPGRVELITAVLFAAVAASVSGCAGALSSVTPAEPSIAERISKVVSDGSTTRDQLEAKLANPSCEVESGRIAFWRLWVSPDDIGGIGKSPHWTLTDFNLVVVFDASGTVVRHTVLRVR